MNIKSITNNATGENLSFTVHEEGYIGSKLDIQLPVSEEKVEKIKIDYATSPR